MLASGSPCSASAAVAGRGAAVAADDAGRLVAPAPVPARCPSREYLRFRLLTQYGDSDAHASRADVVNYLAWCRTQP